MIKAQDLTNEWLTKEDVEEIIKLNTYGISAVFDILLGKKGSIQELEEGVSTNIKHLKELLRSYIIDLHAISCGFPKGSQVNTGSLEDLLKEIISNKG